MCMRSLWDREVASGVHFILLIHPSQSSRKQRKPKISRRIQDLQYRAELPCCSRVDRSPHWAKSGERGTSEERSQGRKVTLHKSSNHLDPSSLFGRIYFRLVYEITQERHKPKHLELHTVFARRGLPTWTFNSTHSVLVSRHSRLPSPLFSFTGIGPCTEPR